MRPLRDYLLTAPRVPTRGRSWVFHRVSPPSARRHRGDPRTMADHRFLLVVAVALEIFGGLWLWRILRLSSPGADLATLLDAVIVGSRRVSPSSWLSRLSSLARPQWRGFRRRGAFSRISLWAAAPVKPSAPSAARDRRRLVSPRS